MDQKERMYLIPIQNIDLTRFSPEGKVLKAEQTDQSFT